MSDYINFSVRQRYLDAVIQEFRDSRIEIPSHQREYSWDMNRRKKLIDTIQRRMPIQSILIRHKEGGKSSLEDGQQRLTTILKYFDGEFSDLKGRKFDELTVEEKVRFKNYQIPVLEYYNSSNAEAIEIFDRFQNGIPLTLGERYHSLSELSPLVSLTKELFLTPEKGFFSRSKKTWGDKSGKDPKRKFLAYLVALTAGAVFGTEYISMKWDDMSDICKRDITDEQRMAAIDVLDKMLAIYERADEVAPLSKKSDINFQFNPSNFSAYIVYSLKTYDGVEDGWVDYIVSVRKEKTRYGGKMGKVLEECLHKDIKESRSWTTERWEMGYLRVFEPEEAERRAKGSDDSTEEDSYLSDESD